MTWQDSDRCTYALSFTERAMAQEVLEEICKLQSKNPSEIRNEEEELDGDYASELLNPSKENLPHVLAELMFTNKQKIMREVVESSFISKMKKITDECADEDSKVQGHVFDIYKQLCNF